MNDLRYLRYLPPAVAFGFALLVAAAAGSSFLEWAAEAQSAPAYRNIPLWPRPFADDSWVIVAKNTLGGVIAGSFGIINAAGAVWDAAPSHDAQQRYLFVADGMNKKIRILLRDNLTEVGAIGSGGRYPGQFLVVNSVAVDSQGNLYTGETHHGKRVQKFVPGK